MLVAYSLIPFALSNTVFYPKKIKPLSPLVPGRAYGNRRCDLLSVSCDYEGRGISKRPFRGF
jgi:hypothetical protein